MKCLKYLRNRISPDFIIDVGAYKGEWSRSAVSVFPDANFVLVEALGERIPELVAFSKQHVRMEVVEALLSDIEADVDFYAMETGSSLFPEMSARSRQVRKCRTTTFDNLAQRMRNLGAARSILLKLDVQGAELKILEGCQKAFPKIKAIYTEVSFHPYNDGAPLIFEIAAFLNKKGFRLTDVVNIYRFSDGRASQSDVIFERSEMPVLLA